MRTQHMRWMAAGLAGWMLAGGGVRAQAQPVPDSDLLLRCRFVGTAVLLANPNAAKLKKMWALPPAGELRQEAVTKLGRAGARWLEQRRAESFPKDAPTALGALLDDLVNFGFHLEARGSSGSNAEWAVAVQLPPERAARWEAEWARLAGGGAKPPNPQDWEARSSGAPNVVHFTRTGGLIVVGVGKDRLKLQPRLVQDFKSGACQVPGLSAWGFEATADLKRLGWLPEVFAPLAWPVLHVTVSNHADVVRTTLRMAFAEPHGWRYEPWSIPDQTIFDPLVSFTAVQGIAALWRQWPALAALQLQPTPNQMAGWAQAQTPFQTYLATPSQQGSNQLKRIAPEVARLFASNPSLAGSGTFEWMVNRGQLAWTHLPYIAPTVTPTKLGNREYLVAGLFPTIRTTNHIPADLLNQVTSRTNLVYYDWELAQERAIHWRQLFQLFEAISHKSFTGSNFASHRLLTQLVPLLDNCITEGTASSPREITFQRRSQTGFTGFELVWLTHWIESEHFPQWSISKPPRSKRTPGAPPPGKSAPKPGAGAPPSAPKTGVAPAPSTPKTGVAPARKP